MVDLEILKDLVREELIANKFKESLRVLEEERLDRAMSAYYGAGFLAISVQEDCDYGCTIEEKQRQDLLNSENEKQIRDDIRSAGFTYIPAYGGSAHTAADGKSSVDEVQSKLFFIIPAYRVGQEEQVMSDHEILRELGVKLAKKYNQDDFLFKPPGAVSDNAYVLDRQGRELTEFIETATPIKLLQTYLDRSYEDIPTIKEASKSDYVLLIPQKPNSLKEIRERRGEIFFHLLGE